MGCVVKDLIGYKFGRENELEVVKLLGRVTTGEVKRALWEAVCHRCGNHFQLTNQNLKLRLTCGNTCCRKYYSKKRRGLL